jgi:hypothetical protein
MASLQKQHAVHQRKQNGFAELLQHKRTCLGANHSMQAMLRTADLAQSCGVEAETHITMELGLLVATAIVVPSRLA